MTALRPLRAGDIEIVNRWLVDPEAGGEFQWVGYGSTQRLRHQFDLDEIISDTGGYLAIVDERDTTVGDVSWRMERTGPSKGSWCWSIGIIIVPERRGMGHGTDAQRLIADYLFAHTTAERIQADTDIDNIAEQKALAKAGYTREGVLRSAQWRAGRWRDMVLFSKLRGEP